MTSDADRTRLGQALAANTAGSGVDHVMVCMPSFGLGDVTLEHYADRIPALEHRYLASAFVAGRIPGCQVIYLCTQHPGPVVLRYLETLGLTPSDGRSPKPLEIVIVPDLTARSLADKLRERPDILAAVRDRIGNRPAFIEPWNVTASEIAVARALDVPINGTDPALWPLGFKSAGRRIFRAAGVAVPYGHEDIRNLDDARRAIDDIRLARPEAPGVVMKLDDSVSGDGNIVLRFARDIDAQLALVPDWYRSELRAGGIVEELIAGDRFSSPSAQLDLMPDGNTRLLATHEQVLGGPDGQTYQGCRFPADPAYAATLARAGLAIGGALARHGVVGRFAVDFAAVEREGSWQVFALEVNLRKGGTTHPFATLRNLVPGHYDLQAGLWIADRGGPRAYWSSDNLHFPEFLGLPPATAIGALRDEGLEFDPATGLGIVLHMLSCLAIDGRCGMTAIAPDPAAADALARRGTEVLRKAARAFGGENRAQG